MSFLFSLAIFLSANSFAGVYDKKKIWPIGKKIISVCIYNPQTADRDQDAVIPNPFLINLTKDVISNAYKTETTIIEFNGFDDCSNLSSPDVVLVFTNKDFGSGYVNRFADFEKNSTIKVFIGLGNKLDTFTKEETQEIETTILHEFGHVAGLQHEHQYFRREALKDPNCHLKLKTGDTGVQWIKGTAKFARSAGKNGALGLMGRIAPYYVAFKRDKSTIGSYDPYSIMNYCYINNNPTSKLSDGDVETLRFMYRNH